MRRASRDDSSRSRMRAGVCGRRTIGWAGGIPLETEGMRVAPLQAPAAAQWCPRRSSPRSAWPVGHALPRLHPSFTPSAHLLLLVCLLLAYLLLARHALLHQSRVALPARSGLGGSAAQSWQICPRAPHQRVAQPKPVALCVATCRCNSPPFLPWPERAVTHQPPNQPRSQRLRTCAPRARRQSWRARRSRPAAHPARRASAPVPRGDARQGRVTRPAHRCCIHLRSLAIA
jgi:hypothetical protein